MEYNEKMSILIYAVLGIIIIIFIIASIVDNAEYKKKCELLGAKKVDYQFSCYKIIEGQVEYYEVVKLDGYYLLREVK